MGFEAVYLWVDPLTSGPIFGSVLVVLLSICYYSFLSVLAYTALFVLGTAAGLKLYVYVMNNFLKKNVADPLAKYAGVDPTVSDERVQQWAACAGDKLNAGVLELRRLFLVDDMFESIKFGLSLWFLTYVGGWFNALTLLILAWVGLFSVPKIYVNNRQALDPILDTIKGHLSEVHGKVAAVMPGKKAQATEAKKEE